MMGGRLMLGALLLAGTAVPALAAQPAVAGWPSASGLAVDPAWRTGVLPNGMRFAIRRNATPPGSAVIRMHIETGSLNEAEADRGIAHFIEHMVFNGTKNVPEGEMVKRLERAGLAFGADTNAQTGFEETIYKLDLPQAKPEIVDEALFLMREVADRATFNPAAIDRERGIILSEERSRDTPQVRALIGRINFLFPGQRLGQRLPIGLTDVIRTATRERMVAYYNAYYRPENTTIVAVGDVDPAELERKIRAGFGDWTGEGPAGAQADQGKPQVRTASAADVLVDPGFPNVSSLMWVRPADLSPDTRAKRIADLRELMGLGVLNQRLQRLATSPNPPFLGAQAMASQEADSGDYTQIFAITAPGGWQAGLTAIEQEQRRLVQYGPTKPELDQVIAAVRGALTNAVGGATTRTNVALAEGKIASLADDTIVTTPADDLGMFEEAVKGLTPAMVQEAVRAAFAGSGPLAQVTAPSAVAGGKEAVLAALQSSTKVAVAAPVERAAATWPYQSFGTPGKVASRREFPVLGATAVTFANGVRLTVRPNAASKDQILVRALVGDGRLDLPTDRAVPGVMLNLGALAGTGLGKITAEDTAQALAGRQAAVAFGVEDNGFRFDGTTRAADFATQMQLLTASITDPGWRAAGWDPVRPLGGTILDRYAASPGGVLERDLQSLLRAGDKRWATPTREQFAAFTVEDLKALLGPALANDPIEVIVVGDVTVDEAIRQTAATFGALPARRAAKNVAPAPRFPAPTAQPVVLTQGGRADQAAGLIAWGTQGLDVDLKTARTMSVLAEVYQLRLTAKLREEQGATYSPAAISQMSDVWDNYGLMFALMEAPPAALPKFFRDAQAIAGELAARPVSADELLRARRPLVERLTQSRTTNAYWLGVLDGLATNPRVAPRIESQIRLVESVTPADLQAAARRFLVPNRSWKLSVVPAAAAAK